MRLKTISAATTQEAMAKVRQELGPDAIIINIDNSGKKGLVRVTAAIERHPAAEPIAEMTPPPPATPSTPFESATLSAMLRYHGLPTTLATRIQTAATAMDAEALDHGLAAGLETLYRFQPIGGAVEPRPLLFVGPPGAGKTLTVAKIAAENAMLSRPVRLITMDTVRAGGLEQLDHFARLMKLTVATAPSPEALRQIMPATAEGDALILIDTVGANPYSLDDVQALARAVKITGAEPVLVLPAGIDALEAAEMADIFASLGARRMIATRLDGARRYAGVLTALYKGGLALAGICAGPFIADGMTAASALALARHIIAKPDPARIAQLKKKAVS